MNAQSLQICATFWRSSLLMPSLHAASIPSSIAGCRGCCLTCNTCVNITATCFKVTTKKIQYALHPVLSFQSTRAQHSHQATTAAKVGATMFPDEASARPPLVVVMVVVEFAAETAVKDMTMATTIKRKDCIALTEIYRSTSTTSKNA